MGTKIIGNWVVKDGKVVADDNCNIIKNMIKEDLKQINTREGGWTILYLSEKDNRYWELSYPQSHMHGGGPPSIEEITEEEIKMRYK